MQFCVCVLHPTGRAIPGPRKSCERSETLGLSITKSSLRKKEVPKLQSDHPHSVLPTFSVELLITVLFILHIYKLSHPTQVQSP